MIYDGFSINVSCQRWVQNRLHLLNRYMYFYIIKRFAVIRLGKLIKKHWRNRFCNFWKSRLQFYRGVAFYRFYFGRSFNCTALNCFVKIVFFLIFALLVYLNNTEITLPINRYLKAKGLVFMEADLYTEMVTIADFTLLMSCATF